MALLVRVVFFAVQTRANAEPKGIGKTLTGRACAAQTEACFLKLAGPSLVQMFIGDGAKLNQLDGFSSDEGIKACQLLHIIRL